MNAGRRLTLDGMIERNMPPRERLALLADRFGETYAGLSRMIQRPDGYLQRFVVHGVPSRLRAAESDLLARYLRVSAVELDG